MSVPLKHLAAPLLALALVSPAQAEEVSSRVIVSSTLNHGLLVLDAASLEFTQPLLPSRGTSPVRLEVAEVEGTDVLFTANHGIAGSVGIFDLSGDLVLENPASPVPTGGFGAVGIDHAGDTLAVTNTWFALGGCSMPKGSLTIYETSLAGTQIALTPKGHHELQGAIPYSAAVDDNGDVYASSNCSASLEVYGDAALVGAPVAWTERKASIQIGNGPDTTLIDPDRDRSYTVNISGNSLSVVDTDSRSLTTTVPLPGAGPIDAALATSKGGEDWIVTANGRDDTFSIISRDAIETCIAASSATCPAAQIARIPAGVAGGAPEGITYDPVSGRVFVVNKYPLGSPSLSAIQIDESASTPTGTLAGVVALPAADPLLPVPAIIAFDAVVDIRS